MFSPFHNFFYYQIKQKTQNKNGRIYSGALARKARASGAPWVSKSTHPKKFGNHVTVHRTNERLSTPKHTNVESHTFKLVWEHRKTSLRGRRSKGKGKGIRARDHARGEEEGGERLQGSHCFRYPTY